MIHSGSRKLGANIADYYNNAANKLNTTWLYDKQVKDQLAFLPLDVREGHDYMEAMNFALDYAKQNRHLLMNRVLNIFLNLVEKYVGKIGGAVSWQVDAHHNYAAIENHYNRNVMVHRKGAIRARTKDTVIIPGSMGSPSYIGTGREYPGSFHSCSHGAGRRMGRADANRRISKEQAEASMNNIIHMEFNGSFDEAPDAYKDISEVMNAQKDLVSIDMELEPLISIKDNTKQKKKGKKK